MSVEKPLITRRPSRVPVTMQAYLTAVESGADLERLEKLMELHQRFEAVEARKAFNMAMAGFRSEAMTIVKTKYVDIAGGAKFWQAELGNICEEVIPRLSAYQLWHNWTPRQREDRMIEVTCNITHELGAKLEPPVTIFAPPDTLGNKTPIHAIASTITFLERYTFLAAIGMSPKGMDTNGATGPGLPDGAAVVEKPSDFDRWIFDLETVAEEGLTALNELWKKSPEDLRNYCIIARKSTWEDCKAKARKRDKERNADA